MTGLGLNLRAHPLAIALANQQLDCVPSWMVWRERFASKISASIKAIPFLILPQVENQDRDRHAWYAYVMLFDSSGAPGDLTREEFVEELKRRGLNEIDIPRSTGLLNELPLFTHAHEAIPRYGPDPWCEPQGSEEFPRAAAFFQSAIKLPMWATQQDGPIVEHYARTIVDVAVGFMDQRREGSTTGTGESRQMPLEIE